MKVFELEFNMFCAVDWRDVTYTITAENKSQLKKEFLNLTQWMSERFVTEFTATKKTQEQKWDEVKNDIVETTLTFPIVKKI